MPRIGATAIAVVLAGAACGQRLDAPAVGRIAAPAPVLMLSASDAALPDIVRRARGVPGVAAVARAALARVDPLEGTAPLLVAAVQPSEFRPLATAALPDGGVATRGLRRGLLLLGGDERARLGIAGGERMLFRGPSGRTASLRVGALATDGILNLADGLVSLHDAARLGMGRPTVALVALRPDLPRAPVVRALSKALETPSRPGTFVAGSAVSAMFGSFWFRSSADGTIEPDPRWVRANIRTRTVPILGTVTCHRLMFRQLVGALREVQRARLVAEIDVDDFHRSGGCYVPRRQLWDPRKPISMHAWGLALDVNVAENPYGARPRQDSGLVAIFERWGFRWGGRWATPDGMHFELTALLRS